MRSEDPANGPIHVLRCTQSGPINYSWQPIDHFVGATLPAKCSVGDIAYKTGVTAGQNIYACTTADTWTQQGGAVSSPSTNGLVFWDGSALATTATGGSGTKCAISVAGATPVWGACSGTAATDWAALSDPSGALSLVMAHNPSTLTFDGTTSTIDGLKLVDTTSNTGTGNLFRASTASGSAMHPVRFDVNGAGVQMSTAGLLAAIGSGGISATHLSGTLLSGLATGILKNTTSTGVPSIAIAADFPVLNQSTTGTAALATAIAGGSGGQVAFQSGAGVTAFSSGLAYNDTTKVLGLISGYTAGQSGTATGTYKVNGTTSGTVTITGASAAGTWTFTVPTSGGSSGQFLQTNGSGVTAWADAAGGAPAVGSITGFGSAGHVIRSTGSAYADSALSASDVSLGSVTNNAQTQAAIVPNTAPSAGQILAGNAGGTAYAPVTLSGSCTMTSAGVMTCSSGSGITSSCGTTTYVAGGTTTIDWTSSNCTKITAATGNTTLALSNPHGVGPYYIELCNDVAGRVWTLPGNLLRASVPSIAECVKAAYTYDGTNYSGDGSDETPSTMRLDSERSAPATPAANKSVGWLDSTNHDLEFKFNNSANIYRLVLQGIDITTSTGRVTGINGTAISGTSGNVWTYGASNTAADAGFLATNVVRKDAANTWATGAQDFGSATSLKVPVGAGATTATNGFVAYDSTNNMLHAAQSGADAKVPQFTVTPTNAHCVTWVVSGSNYKLGDTACASGGGGGVNAQTANYTLVSGDSGMLVTMNGVSLTATLPASPPSSTWSVWIENLAATALTISRNSLTINGGTTNITLQQYQWTIVYTDGTNYFAKPPVAAGANITLTMSSAAETIVGAAATGCTPGGASGDLQKNNGAGGCSASALNDSGTSITSTEPVSLGSNYLSTSQTAGSTGTTANTLCKLNSSNQVVTAATSDVGILGVCVTTQTTGQAVETATRGIINCVADNSTTVGNLLGVGTTTGGRCKDLGTTDSTAVANNIQIIGRAKTAVSAAANVSVQLYGPGHYGTQVVTAGVAANAIGNGQLAVVQTRRVCTIDNDTQSATALTVAQMSGRCLIPAAATIVEVDVIGGTGTINGSAAAPTVTGTSSIQIGKYTPNGGASTTGLLSGALATASGKACAMTSTSGTCIDGTTSSGSITISTTALAAGDMLYISAATADAAQTWYRASIVYTIN